MAAIIFKTYKYNYRCIYISSFIVKYEDKLAYNINSVIYIYHHLVIDII